MNVALYPTPGKPFVGKRVRVLKFARNDERGISDALGTIVEYRLFMGQNYPIGVFLLLLDGGTFATVTEDDIKIEVTP